MVDKRRMAVAVPDPNTDRVSVFLLKGTQHVRCDTGPPIPLYPMVFAEEG
jgi:hypothetical protein